MNDSPGNESNATNSNGFELPCNVVCVAATGGGVLLLLVLTAFTLLIICLCVLKQKRGDQLHIRTYISC